MRTTLLTTCLLLTSTICAEMHSALTLRHRESQGVGYNQGYSTMDYYLTSQHDELQFLFNLRGHLFNDAKAAGNAGLAFRYSLDEDRSRIGMNLYYDLRDGPHFLAQQAAGGLEWMSRNMDVRVNGYVPVGRQRSFRQHTFQRFAGNTGLIRRKLTGTLPCIDGEIGTPLARPIYFAAGSYYLFEQTDHSLHLGKAWGWKARFDVDMGNYFTLGAVVTHDRIFKTRVQGYLALDIPLGPWKAMKDSSKNLERRRIIRNEIIPVQSRKKSKIPLTPTPGALATRFLFVNNKAPAQGSGTFERPFSSLKEAERNSNDGDVIYVFPGDKTPRHLDEGIVLKNNQILASSGADLQLNDVVIPAQTPHQHPVVTNIHSRVVVANPGRSELRNFFYMDPWEYMQAYGAPSYAYDTPSSPSVNPQTPPGGPSFSGANDTPYAGTRDWVNLDR